jgi:zinc/manganese transport system ATP-binding protein
VAASSEIPLTSYHVPGGTVTPTGVPAIQARRVEVRYRNKLVWKDATFDVQPGEFVAVIGPNGAGKTTLFRMLLGLHYPSTGTLAVLGAPPHRGNARIGYVPQRHTIDKDTHLECDKLVRLAYPGTPWGPGDRFRPTMWGPRFRLGPERDAAAKALADVGASDLGDKPLGSLSGGELQKVFLAEALVGNPDMLLLDEPLSNLDIRRSRELVETVHGLVQSRGVTTLLVAHDINPLIKCLDKVIYIANGKVATGRPSEVLTTESLTALYGVHVEVLHDSRGNIVIVGGEDDRGEEGE